MENAENQNWKKSCNSNIKLKLTINNETVNDSQTIANEFNHFFVSIGPALADNITCFVDPKVICRQYYEQYCYLIGLLYGYQD